MMWRRLLILDLVLVAVLVAGTLRVRRSWQEFEGAHRVAAVQPDREPVPALSGSALVTAAAQDWTDISVKNPFSFDRNDIAIVAPTQATPTTPKPVLFGVMSIGNEKIAMLSPGQSGRASRPVKVGESVDSWQVVEIADKSVVVTAENGTRQTIIMNDPTAQVARSIERTGTGQPSLGMVISAPSAVSNSTANTPASTAPAAQPGNAAPSNPDILVTPFGNVTRTKP